MRKKRKKGFTLLEVTIVIAITAVIFAGLVILIDPLGQINKANNTKRKADLSQLQKALEDWYNDKGCYPKPSEICYDNPVNNCTGLGAQNRLTVVSQTCHICGSNSNSPSFSPYLDPLPCDPQSPRFEYLYEVEPDGARDCTIDHTANCPQWYRAYSDFGSISSSDNDSEAVGCTRGSCGPVGTPPAGTIPYGYDYGIASPNERLQKSTNWTCFNATCKGCGTSYNQCLEAGCPDPSKIYSSAQACQQAN